MSVTAAGWIILIILGIVLFIAGGMFMKKIIEFKLKVTGVIKNSITEIEDEYKKIKDKM